MFDGNSAMRPPSARDSVLARESAQLISRLASPDHDLKLTVKEEGQDETLVLPAGAVALLMDILENMAAGRGITLIPQNAELTTVQAAAILNVSRPFLIKLLDEKAIPHHKTGKHRRIRIEDVMAYKVKVDQDREAVLDRLTTEAQAQGMGY